MDLPNSITLIDSIIEIRKHVSEDEENAVRDIIKSNHSVDDKKILEHGEWFSVDGKIFQKPIKKLRLGLMVIL